MTRRIETRCPECGGEWYRENAYTKWHWSTTRQCMSCRSPLTVLDRGEGTWELETRK